MEALKIFMWGLVISMVGVVFFVKSPDVSGVSGGQQASMIINSTTAGFAKILNVAEGGGLS